MLDSLKKLLPFWTALGLALLIAGICCLCMPVVVDKPLICNNTAVNYKEEDVKIIEYKDCLDKDDTNTSCADVAKQGRVCFCLEYLNIKELVGDIIIYYQLETFNESRVVKNDTDFWKSRDNDQLRGVLDKTPSNSCEPFLHDESGRVIVPCGAIADAMFTDSITLKKGTEIVPSLSYQILGDKYKEGFNNPDRDFSVAFVNFTQPKSWGNRTWQRIWNNTVDENRGLQNEALIAWMHTEWDRKPMWRLNRSEPEFQNGLPAGNYTIIIDYSYSPLLYDGPRKLIISRKYPDGNITECHNSSEVTESANTYNLGITGVVTGIIFLMISAASVISYKVSALQRRGHTVNATKNPKIVVTPTSDSSEGTDNPPFSKVQTSLNYERTLLDKSPDNEDDDYL